MAKTLRNAVNSPNPMRANYLMEAKRLECLDKAVKSAYGLIFSIDQLRKLDQTIMKGIDKLIIEYI